MYHKNLVNEVTENIDCFSLPVNQKQLMSQTHEVPFSICERLQFGDGHGSV